MKKIKVARERILDWRVQKAYDKYQKYLLELDVYQNYIIQNGSNKINMFRLLSLYKKSGIEVKDKKNIESRFREFSDIIEEIKQENPDIDLTDISTQSNRKIVSDIIYQIQNDRNFKTADLDAVAVIENYSLYAAVFEVNNNRIDVRYSSY